MDKNKILTRARQHLKERIISLESDVRNCVDPDNNNRTWHAYFPAILYCFSTIDLLGQLYKGDATDKATTTVFAKDYLTEVMQYPKKTAKLMQDIFRHKIVHLAQPRPKVEDGKDKYTWRMHRNNRSEHLTTLQADNKENEYCFNISIWSLVEDIKRSISKPDGYLHKLETEEELRRKYNKAHYEIFPEEENQPKPETEHLQK